MVRFRKQIITGTALLAIGLSTAQTKTQNQGLLGIQGVVGSVSEINNSVGATLINDGELHVYNHFNNDGTVTFTTGNTTGLTLMNGLFGSQKISGSTLMHWYNCEFDNNLVQPAFQLSNQVAVHGNADFFQGIVDDDNFGGLLIFEDNATHSNTDNQSHVDGFVRKNGNDAFRFPIGDAGHYRYAAQSNPSATADAFSSKYFLENSNLLYPHTNRAPLITLIDTAEYWSFLKTNAQSNVFLTLSWDEATTPAAIYATPFEEIHIVRWDETLNLWVDEGGVADPALKEVTTVINPLTQYGIFTLARVKRIIPCADFLIHNTVSANDDGTNDIFTIDNIEYCPQNSVAIYNRWGVKVFETTAYNTSGNVFRGYSSARLTMNDSEKLPNGTYFYVIKLEDPATGISNSISGFLQLF